MTGVTSALKYIPSWHYVTFLGQERSRMYLCLYLASILVPVPSLLYFRLLIMLPRASNPDTNLVNVTL